MIRESKPEPGKEPEPKRVNEYDPASLTAYVERLEKRQAALAVSVQEVNGELAALLAVVRRLEAHKEKEDDSLSSTRNELAYYRRRLKGGCVYCIAAEAARAASAETMEGTPERAKADEATLIVNFCSELRGFPPKLWEALHSTFWGVVLAAAAGDIAPARKELKEVLEALDNHCRC